jgi:hypothetical protein
MEFDTGGTKMKRLIYIISALLLMTGCSATNQESNGNSENPDSMETTSPSIDLADFEATLEIEPTKEAAIFNLTFSNQSDEVAEVSFSSGQRFEIVVSDTKGNEVYRYSEGKMFTMAIQMLKLEAGDQLTFQDSWDYKVKGNKVDLGEYKVVATVLPMEINGKKLDNDLFKAEGTFTIESTETTDSTSGQTDTNESNTGTNNSETDNESNKAFRSIKAVGENGEYTITGEARVFEAVFMYAVEDGHNELIKETPFYANEGAPAWSAFELKISIPKEKLPKNGTLIAYIYERSAKDGSIVNSYYVPLEQFN